MVSGFFCAKDGARQRRRSVKKNWVPAVLVGLLMAFIGVAMGAPTALIVAVSLVAAVLIAAIL